MSRFWEQLTQYVTRPFAAIFAQQVIAEAEVFTAMSRAQSLRTAYEKADGLEADGFPNLARELRETADAITLRSPGQYSLEYIDSLPGDPESGLLVADRNGGQQPRISEPSSSSQDTKGQAPTSNGKGRRRSKNRSDAPSE